MSKCIMTICGIYWCNSVALTIPLQGRNLCELNRSQFRPVPNDDQVDVLKDSDRGNRKKSIKSPTGIVPMDYKVLTKEFQLKN